MITLEKEGNNLAVYIWSECGWTYVIEHLAKDGFESEYNQISDDEAEFIYPNYKKADEIVCGYAGCDTMREWNDNWKYLKEV